MKKFLTLLSAALISVVSFATVASAEDVYKPTVALDVTNVLPNGNAIITATLDVAKDLDFNNQGDGYDWVNGSGITSWQINMALDENIFKKDSAIVTGTYSLDFTKVKASKNGVVTIGTANIGLQDAYKGKTKAELNALKFASVTNAVFEITTWVDCFDVMDSSTITSQINYRSDEANGAIGVDLSATRIGTYVDAPPAPTASVAISAAKKTTDANWIAENGNTMFWGVDFANGGFNGTAVAKIFSDAKERELTIATPADTAINGEASFGVFVIVGDSTDAIGLTVTSGDVTATAAPVAYADAE